MCFQTQPIPSRGAQCSGRYGPWHNGSGSSREGPKMHGTEHSCDGGLADHRHWIYASFLIFSHGHHVVICGAVVSACWTCSNEILQNASVIIKHVDLRNW